MTTQEDNCHNCGAPLHEDKTTCEYCGSEFKMTHEKSVANVLKSMADDYNIAFSNPLASGVIYKSSL